MLGDTEIKPAIADGLMAITPMDPSGPQPAGYDMRVGREASVRSSNEKIDVANKGLVLIDPGELAVVVTREQVRCGPRIAGQLGLSSTDARQGLTMLSGPRIDPGLDPKLIVRVTNLAPRRITLGYEGAFLMTQSFKLSPTVERPSVGSRQGKSRLSARDIEGTADPDSPTLGGRVRTLQALAADVGSLRTGVHAMAWVLGIGLNLVVALVGLTVGLKS